MKLFAMVTVPVTLGVLLRVFAEAFAVGLLNTLKVSLIGIVTVDNDRFKSEVGCEVDIDGDLSFMEVDGFWGCAVIVHVVDSDAKVDLGRGLVDVGVVD